MSGIVQPLPALTKYFESAEQTITAAGAVVIAHGFGVQPKFVLGMLVNQVANIGYTPGDQIMSFVHSQGTTLDRGISVLLDATNVTLRFAATSPVFSVMNKTTGSNSPMVITSWKYKIRVFA